MELKEHMSLWNKGKEYIVTKITISIGSRIFDEPTISVELLDVETQETDSWPLREIHRAARWGELTSEPEEDAN